MTLLFWILGVYLILGVLLFLSLLFSADWHHVDETLHSWWLIIFLYPFILIKHWLDEIHEHKGFK